MAKKLWFYLHWFLGLTAGFVLMIVGVSGALLSFEKEILESINHSSLHVSVPAKAEPLSIDALVQRFVESHKDARIAGVTKASDPSSSFMIHVETSNNQKKSIATYYLNPYNGDELLELRGKALFQTILEIHRRLLFGDVGKNIVGASTLALILLMVSGVYLYWGSLRKNFLSSMKVNFRIKGRGFLYKLHSALGVWVLIPFTLLALTGLFWSYDWYKSSIYTLLDVQRPAKKMKQMELQKLPTTRTYETFDRALELFHDMHKRPYETAMLRALTPQHRIEISYTDTHAPHTRARNTMVVDVQEHTLISHTRYDEKRLGERLIISMLPLHSGEYFGIVGRTVMFIASLSMLVLGISALLLYLHRRKKRRLKHAKLQSTL